MSRRQTELPQQNKTAELVCSAACCSICRLIKRLRVSASRHRHVLHHHRHHEIRRRLELRAKRVHVMMFRAKRVHGKVRLVMGVEHYYVRHCWRDRTRGQVHRGSFRRPR